MKAKKPLPKGAVQALIVVGGVLVLFVGWMLVVSPVKKHIASLDAQTLATQQQIADRIAQAHPASAAAGAPQIHVADIYRIAKAMPSITDMPDILLELDQTALAAGVTLISIGPGAPAPAAAGGYTTIPITLSVTGDFYTVTDLLYRLRNLVSVRDGALETTGRLFSVTSVTLAPAGTGVTAAVALQTYVYGAVSAPGAAAAPATTTATATTSTNTTGTTTTNTTTSSSGPSAAGATP